MIHVAILCSSLVTVMLADPPTAEEVSAYQATAAVLGRDADAHVRLASWCEARGLNAERHKHLAIALEIDPNHAPAHGLLGQVADNGEWRMPEVVVDEHRGDAAASATLALYRARRDKIPDTAQAHWQLAEWCDQNGLKAEATAHLTAVLRLNPAHEQAWKKLGYRKQKGRWTAAEQTVARTEAEAQRRADAKWRPLLQKWSAWMERKARHADAEAALAEVHDPRAVPSIWRVFIAAGDPAEQEQGVRLLCQIDAPAASRALASLAVLGGSDVVRHSAAVGLLRRDPREFAGFLISLLRDPIKYEVRMVEGPGKPGELYVHGERVNRRFFYAAPPPLATLGPTDVVGFDYDGLPIATRVVGYMPQPLAAAIDPLLSGAPDLTGAPQILGRTALGQAGAQLGERMLQNQQANTSLALQMEGMMNPAPLGPGTGAIPKNLQNSMPSAMQGPGGGPMVPMPLTAQIPVGRLMVQAEQQAARSRAQLEEDVAALDRYNKDVNQVNDRATAALDASLLENHGPQRQAWVKWWTDRVESYSSASPRPRENGPEASLSAVEKRSIVPAMGADTPVWGLSGVQPVKAIRTGDLVLTQDTATGALAFAPVLTIHQTERQLVKKLMIGNSPMVATDIERFWVAGKGWSMVLDLKAGDALRGLGAVIRLASIEDAGAQPVYQVQVAAGRGIIVGTRGILAHDERISFPATSLFDAAVNEEAARPRVLKDE